MEKLAKIFLIGCAISLLYLAVMVVQLNWSIMSFGVSATLICWGGVVLIAMWKYIDDL